MRIFLIGPVLSVIYFQAVLTWAQGTAMRLGELNDSDANYVWRCLCGIFTQSIDEIDDELWRDSNLLM